MIVTQVVIHYFINVYIQNRIHQRGRGIILQIALIGVCHVAFIFIDTHFAARFLSDSLKFDDILQIYTHILS